MSNGIYFKKHLPKTCEVSSEVRVSDELLHYADINFNQHIIERTCHEIGRFIAKEKGKDIIMSRQRNPFTPYSGDTIFRTTLYAFTESELKDYLAAHLSRGISELIAENKELRITNQRLLNKIEDAQRVLKK